MVFDLNTVHKLSRKEILEKRFEPGAAGWEERMLPLCYAPPSPLNYPFLWVLRSENMGCCEMLSFNWCFLISRLTQSLLWKWEWRVQFRETDSCKDFVQIIFPLLQFRFLRDVVRWITRSSIEAETSSLEPQKLLFFDGWIQSGWKMMPPLQIVFSRL